MADTSSQSIPLRGEPESAPGRVPPDKLVGVCATSGAGVAVGLTLSKTVDRPRGGTSTIPWVQSVLKNAPIEAERARRLTQSGANIIVGKDCQERRGGTQRRRPRPNTTRTRATTWTATSHSTNSLTCPSKGFTEDFVIRSAYVFGSILRK